jgi:hypothetical protein
MRNVENLAFLTWLYNNLEKIDFPEEEDYIPITDDVAKRWVSRMKNTDGTMGEHWTMAQTTSVMQSKGVEHISEPLFYVVMNMLYSDYYKVAEKHGVANDIDFWVDMACAWLYDDDVHRNKTSLYYEHIVKK